MGRFVRSDHLVSSLLTLTLFTALAVPRVVHAQGSGTIEGTVIDAGSRRPLPGAQVTVIASQAGGVLGTQTGAIAGQNGQFRIVGVAVGSRQVRARHLGYAAVSRTEAGQHRRDAGGTSASADLDFLRAASGAGARHRDPSVERPHRRRGTHPNSRQREHVAVE
jgi:hypothetical protein